MRQEEKKQAATVPALRLRSVGTLIRQRHKLEVRPPGAHQARASEAQAAQDAQRAQEASEAGGQKAAPTTPEVVEREGQRGKRRSMEEVGAGRRKRSRQEVVEASEEGQGQRGKQAARKRSPEAEARRPQASCSGAAETINETKRIEMEEKMRHLKVAEVAARKTGEDMLAAQKKQMREVLAALITEFGEEAVHQGIEAVSRIQRAKPKEGNGAEAGK